MSIRNFHKRMYYFLQPLKSIRSSKTYDNDIVDPPKKGLEVIHHRVVSFSVVRNLNLRSLRVMVQLIGLDDPKEEFTTHPGGEFSSTTGHHRPWEKGLISDDVGWDQTVRTRGRGGRVGKRNT